MLTVVLYLSILLNLAACLLGVINERRRRVARKEEADALEMSGSLLDAVAEEEPVTGEAVIALHHSAEVLRYFARRARIRSLTLRELRRLLPSGNDDDTIV